MKKWIITLLAGVLLSGTAVVQAAPASGYSQFMQSLDSIMAGATMPVADEQLIAARTGFQPSGQAAQVLAVARDMLGQPVVWGELRRRKVLIVPVWCSMYTGRPG